MEHQSFAPIQYSPALVADGGSPGAYQVVPAGYQLHQAWATELVQELREIRAYLGNIRDGERSVTNCFYAGVVVILGLWLILSLLLVNRDLKIVDFGSIQDQIYQHFQGQL